MLRVKGDGDGGYNVVIIGNDAMMAITQTVMVMAAAIMKMIVFVSYFPGICFAI